MTKSLKGNWYDGARIGHLDIETTNLEADCGPMLSWAIKVEGEPTLLWDCVRPSEIRGKVSDRRIVKSLLKALASLDIICTYYGTGFDVPFIRTRALHHGLAFPEFGSLYHWDLYYCVRNKLKIHRNSLDAACALVGIHGKTHLDLAIWDEARRGDRAALDYVMEHNCGDVAILEELFHKMQPFQKWSKKSV